MRRARGSGNRPSRLARAAISFSMALAGLAIATSARAECSRDKLQWLADTYVEAQKSGNPDLVPLAAGSYYGENDVAMDVSRGVLSQALKVDFTRSFLDTTQCATFTELVAASDPHPYVIHTRMEVSAEGEVTKMESVVTDDGDWVFGADGYLAVTKGENWDEIPVDHRSTVADAYLDNWGNPELPVPHGTPCHRLEGRLNTGSRNPEGNTCNMGAFPEKLNVTNRRYVIDETIGAVSIFHNFPWLDAGISKDPGTPASQMFRVEGGKNRYIHETTVCTTPKCGRGR